MVMIDASKTMGTALKALERELCDHCLGRLFARTGFGLTNSERGKAVRISLAISIEDIEEASQQVPPEVMARLPVHFDLNEVTTQKLKERFVDEDGWTNEPTPDFMGHLSDDHEEGTCWLCHDVFNTIPDLVHLIMEKVPQQEFNTYQVGSRIDPSTLERERKIWEELEPSNAEPLKEELNRELGKALSPRIPEKEFDRDGPDVIFLVDPLFRKVEVKKKPMFIHGRYEKLKRGIPQSRWICKRCGGKGCSKCQNKGKMYETSVEEEIGSPLMQALEGTNYKIHGKGREDVDVRCIGRGRPFIIEISEPDGRFLDLKVMERSINDLSEGKVKVHGLRWSTRKEVPSIKKGDTMKRYSAIISSPEGLDEENLKYKVPLLGQRSISQRTPRRVSHRRADLVRERKVHEISFEVLDGNRARIDLLTDGGLYIKELLHGDEGRTDPNLASLMEREIIVETLDVTDVLDEKDRISGVK